MHRHRTIAAEVKGAVVGTKVGFVVGAVAVGLFVACVADLRDGSPLFALLVNDIKMVLVITGQAARAAKDEEGAIGRDLGIHVRGGSIAERERLGGLISAVL